MNIKKRHMTITMIINIFGIILIKLNQIWKFLNKSKNNMIKERKELKNYNKWNKKTNKSYKGIKSYITI